MHVSCVYMHVYGARTDGVLMMTSKSERLR